MLTVTTSTSMVTKPETTQKREMLQRPTMASIKTSLMTKEEVMIEEEEILLMIVKKVITRKRDPGTLGMKIMLLPLNLNTFLFLPFLVPLLHILVIVDWYIVGLLDIYLGIRKSSQIWLRWSLI